LPVKFPHPLLGQFRVLNLLDALPPHLGQPTLERFGLRAGDRLDDAEGGFRVDDLGLIVLPVGSGQFQLSTKCRQLDSRGFNPPFRWILSGSRTPKRRNHLDLRRKFASRANAGEIPCVLLGIKRAEEDSAFVLWQFDPPPA
jgi:hypothetical protein